MTIIQVKFAFLDEDYRFTRLIKGSIVRATLAQHPH